MINFFKFISKILLYILELKTNGTFLLLLILCSVQLNSLVVQQQLRFFHTINVIN